MAVIDNNVSINKDLLKRRPEDYHFEPFRGSGAGGQHRNKNWTGIRCIHIPTGTKQERTTKSQHNNKQNALIGVNKILDEMISKEKNSQISVDRKSKVGSGMRGDKIRTYRFQDDRVIDHNSRRTAKASKVMRGHFNLLW